MSKFILPTTVRIRIYLVITGLIVLLWACGSKVNKNNSEYGNLARISYCDLPKNIGKDVILKAKYEGTMEYWSLSSIEPCDTNLSVNFDVRGIYNRVPEKLKNKQNLRLKYFIVEAVGKYSNEKTSGYGHLGLLKSNFVVTDILGITEVFR
jgi:hypothetical protein